jgi:homocitrate synthase NifV
LHADGVIKDPHNYEGFDPAEVGLERTIAIGKHSGSSGLVERYRTMGIAVDRTRAGLLLEHARRMACRLKRDLTNRELLAINLDGGMLPKAA